MKKNIVGHMMKPKESAGSFFRSLNILPRLICLLLALAIWLLIVNLDPNEKKVGTDQSVHTEQSA